MQDKADSKRLVKNSALLYFRMLITMFISLYTSRVVLAELGVTDYGLYNVIGGIVTLFAFVQSALGNSTWRYITVSLGKGDFKDLNKTYSSAVFLHALFCVLILFVAESIGLWFLYNKMTIPSTRMTEALWVYEMSVVSIVFMVMSSPSSSLITAHEKMSAFAYISIFEAVSKLIVASLLVLFPHRKLLVYAFLLCLVQVSVRIMYAIYCKRHFPESRLIYVWDQKLLKEMSNFAGYTLLPGLGFACCGQGLNILLNIFFGPIANAARGIAVQVQHFLTTFVQSFQQAVNPQITKLYASDSIVDMHNLIVKTSKFSFYILLLPALPLIMLIHPILDLWLVNTPQYTADFCRLTIIICLTDSISNPFLVGGAANGRVKKLYTLAGIILVLILPISYLFLCHGFPAIFVYYVHLAMSVILQVVRIVISSKLINFNIKRCVNEIIYPIAITTIASSIFAFILRLIITESDFLSIVAYTISLLVITLVIMLTVGVTKTEKQALQSFVYSRFISKHADVK